LTFSGSLTAKSATRSFTVAVDDGVSIGQLSFSRCKSLALALSTGASTTGPSVLLLESLLTRRSYTYTVSGGSCSFVPTVTAPSP